MLSVVWRSFETASEVWAQQTVLDAFLGKAYI